MDDNYDDTGAVPNKPTANAEPEKMEGENSDQPTAIIPKSLLAGKEFNVGDEVCLEITEMHEDDVSVRYSQKSGKGDNTPETGSSESSMYD
jgi:hypothetical protein